MYEKQVEADNQLTLFKEEKKNLYDEISSLKGDMDQRLAVRESDVNKLSESKDLLGKKSPTFVKLNLMKDIFTNDIPSLSFQGNFG